MKKGTPIINRRPSLSIMPDYKAYIPWANKYLDLEAKLRKLQGEEKALKKRIYAVSNEMASVSSNHLQLLGHQVVDQLREERDASQNVS